MIKAREILVPSDANAVADLAILFHQECDPTLAFNYEEVIKSCALILSDIEREHENCWIVWEDESDMSRPIGFAVGQVSKYYFSSEKYATLLEWYVMRDYRKTRASFELLHTWQEWGRLLGCTRQIVGAARQGLSTDVKKINAMFERRGFKSYGELFFKELT